MSTMQLNSMPALIAWLSVCLLAAAGGSLLDDRWQVVWAEAGAFGLVAAVGLASMEQVRATRELHSRDHAMRTRLESGLARLNQHSATIDTINVAVRRLAEHAATQRRAPSSNAGHAAERGWEAERLVNYPVEILPLEEHGAMYDPRLTQPILGQLRQISSAVVSFGHFESFATRLVLLTFDLGDDEHFSFVVEVMWTHDSGQELVSSGTVWAVGVRAEKGSYAAPAEPVPAAT